MVGATVSVNLVVLALAALTQADDMDGFVPGFSTVQIFIPSNCTHRAREGDYMYQQYIGTLEDGTKFDSSYDRGNTFNFHLGVGEVIKGIDMGMKGMCKGEKRKITIPPELGYGNREVGSIPAGSTLIFEVELADVEPSGFQIDLMYMPEDCKRRSAAGDYIREHYNGTFVDGSPFDSSYDRDQTYDFTLGERQVIKGVDLGLMNMCEGERRKLTIPPILAYGKRGYGDIIPPDSTIVFEAELVEIVSGKLKWYKIDGPQCPDEDAVALHDSISIIYSGFTDSSFKFSSGEDSYTFTVGDNVVLHGLNQGVIGMCVGERRRLRIPPELAVGDINAAGVPANVRLTLDIELIEAHKENLFKTIDSNKDRYLSEEEVKAWLTTNPDFAELIKDNEEELNKLMSLYYKEKDVDGNGWVSRDEFYGSVTSHDEL